MKVTRWSSREDTMDLASSCGGMGGWVDKSTSWKDYIEKMPIEAVPYLEALRDDILEKDIYLTGEDHQYTDTGVPVFEDNTIGAFTYRAWGDLMAAIWNSYRCIDQCYRKGYMDYYM